MQKTILVTGSTDGIGLETAKKLLSEGHHVLLHGRSQTKLKEVETLLSASGTVESYVADLSRMSDVEAMAEAIIAKHKKLDVLINNAGVYSTPAPVTESGLDVRFLVNTIAPYLLTKKLLPVLGSEGRVINLSSAAQAPVDIQALEGDRRLNDGEAYAQSKLALTMWSRHLGLALKESGPAVIAVNPASFLGSKMVKDAYGVAGKDLSIGVDILCRAALSDEFAQASGLYFDNDTGRFSDPHPDGMDDEKSQKLVAAMDALLAE